MSECSITAATWHGGQAGCFRRHFVFHGTASVRMGRMCISQGGRHTIVSVKATIDNKINNGRF